MITVYTITACAYCPLVKRYLDMKKVEYEVIDVTHDPVMRSHLHAKTGYSTVPVTTDNESYVVGWKPGELANLIRKQK